VSNRESSLACFLDRTKRYGPRQGPRATKGGEKRCLGVHEGKGTSPSLVFPGKKGGDLLSMKGKKKKGKKNKRGKSFARK